MPRVFQQIDYHAGRKNVCDSVTIHIHSFFADEASQQCKKMEKFIKFCIDNYGIILYNNHTVYGVICY